jgi:ABC-type histidine transport system ATPase subunit
MAMARTAAGLVQIDCRKKQAVDDTVQELTREGLTVAGCPCHVGDGNQRRAFLERALQVDSNVGVQHGLEMDALIITSP